VFNVHDDDLVTCREYLRLYRAQVKKLRVLPIPYPVLRVLSVAIEWLPRGQQGAAARALHALQDGHHLGRQPLRQRPAARSLGFAPIVSTDEGLRRTLEHLAAKAQS
jgi:hypothetical protein